MISVNSNIECGGINYTKFVRAISLGIPVLFFYKRNQVRNFEGFMRAKIDQIRSILYCYEVIDEGGEGCVAQKFLYQIPKKYSNWYLELTRF